MTPTAFHTSRRDATNLSELRERGREEGREREREEGRGREVERENISTHTPYSKTPERKKGKKKKGRGMRGDLEWMRES